MSVVITREQKSFSFFQVPTGKLRVKYGLLFSRKTQTYIYITLYALFENDLFVGAETKGKMQTKDCFLDVRKQNQVILASKCCLIVCLFSAKVFFKITSTLDQIINRCFKNLADRKKSFFHPHLRCICCSIVLLK